MNEKKRILFISTKSVLGGAQRYIVDLVDYLPKDQFEVFVAAGGSGPLAVKMRERAVPYYEIPHLGKKVSIFKDISSLFHIISIIKKVRPDVLHLNSSKASGLGAVAGRIARVPRIISSTHGWPFLEERPEWQRKLIFTATKLGIALQDKVICVSDYDHLIGIQQQVTDPKKLVQVHNGVDQKKHIFLEKNIAQEKLFTKLGIAPGKYFIIGSIAEYTKNKGLLYLIEAASQLVKFEPRALFFLMGWGEEKSFLEMKIEGHGLQKNVFLIDSMPEAFTYLKALDVFILPSLKEGFAYTLLEASLAELPIITTRVGGNPEIIDNLRTGLLINPASPQEIINAVTYVMRQPADAAVFGIEARKKVIRNFSIDSMVQLTARVYNGD